ncbi:MAG: RidA family protein [Acetobacterales bacterium]
MAADVEKRLAEAGITLPEAPKPVANYVAYTISGNLVFVSGQVPLEDGKVAVTGKLGDLPLEEGQRAARVCAINILSQLKAACGGDLGKVRRIVRLGGFVACKPDFTKHPLVINAASDLMVAAFGDAGRHARAAVGVPSLPLDAAVEIDAIAEIG